MPFYKKIQRCSTYSVCNLKFNVYNEIPVVFHNGSNYDYHFIIKELANKFEGQFECLVENTEKYKTFSAPTEKKKLQKLIKTVTKLLSHIINYIDSARFMASSL